MRCIICVHTCGHVLHMHGIALHMFSMSSTTVLLSGRSVSANIEKLSQYCLSVYHILY